MLEHHNVEPTPINPTRASSPMMARSYVVTKPLWLSPRSWYIFGAQNVEAVVVSMYLPVHNHPGTVSFIRNGLPLTERLIIVRSSLNIFTIAFANQVLQNLDGRLCSSFAPTLYRRDDVERREGGCHTTLAVTSSSIRGIFPIGRYL